MNWFVMFSRKAFAFDVGDADGDMLGGMGSAVMVLSGSTNYRTMMK